MMTRPRTAYDIQKLGRLEEHLKRKPQDLQARRERDTIIRDTYLEPPKPAPAPPKPVTPVEPPDVTAYKLLLDVRTDLDGIFVVPPSQAQSDVTKRLVTERIMLVVDPKATQGLMVARAVKPEPVPQHVQYVQPVKYDWGTGLYR